ncbi:SCO family protein [Rhodoblastus sp.]|uniref:SCO family protein n=1 Tax=Rhodoblastus sp. TaxID=1962975 RepID=UPI0035AE951B
MSLPEPGSYKLDRILRTPFSVVYDGTGFPHLLSSYTTGRITLLTFFYSECSDPQGCPLAWNAFEAMRKKIKDIPELRGKVRLVSFSFDPRNDRPNILDVFAQSYNDDRAVIPWEFIGAWSNALLNRTLNAFGQDVLVDQAAAKTGANTINHILRVFLIDRDGWVREIYTSAFLNPDIILGDIRTLQIEEEQSHLDK